MSTAPLMIPLEPPIEAAGGKLAELHLREPTGKEMLAAEEKLINVGVRALSDYSVALVASSAGIEPKMADELLNELPVSKLREAFAFVQAFDAAAAAPDPLPDTLDVPVDVTDNGVAFAVLTLREPTVGMRRVAERALDSGYTPANRRRYQMIIVSRAAGVPYTVAEATPVSALNRAEAYLRGFIDGGRPAGTS